MKVKGCMPTLATAYLAAAAAGCAGPATRPEAAEVVQAQRFVLVDASGARRAELESHDAVTSLTFYDERGEIRLLLGLDGRSERTLILINRGDGSPGVQLGMESAGEPALGFASEDGAPRIILGVGRRGPGLRLMDEKGVERADLNVGSDGAASLMLRDGRGNPTAKLPRESE